MKSPFPFPFPRVPPSRAPAAPRPLGQTLAPVAGAERAARPAPGSTAAPRPGQCPAETPGATARITGVTGQDFMGFHGDLMGFHGDLMGFNGDLMGLSGI